MNASRPARTSAARLDLDDINAQLDLAADAVRGADFEDAAFDDLPSSEHAASAPAAAPGSRSPRPSLPAAAGPSALSTPAAPAADTAGRAGENPFARLARLGDKSAALREQMDAQAAEIAHRVAKQEQDREAAIAADPAWAHDELPAGSAFSAEEWARAREGGKYIVFEMRTGSQGALMQAERRPSGDRSHVKVGGEVRQVERPLAPEVAAKYLDPLQEMMFDGCLVLGPAATTTHPGSVTNTYVMKGTPVAKGGLGDWTYRIVRPRQHLQTMPWMFTATGWCSAEGGAHEGDVQEPESASAFDSDESVQRPRMAG